MEEGAQAAKQTHAGEKDRLLILEEDGSDGLGGEEEECDELTASSTQA